MSSVPQKADKFNLSISVLYSYAFHVYLQAIETLKSFEKKDTKVACTAATNLAFLYFLVSPEDGTVSSTGTHHQRWQMC